MCEKTSPFHLFDSGRTSLRMETKCQLCSEEPLECGGHFELCITGLRYLKYRTYELPSLKLHQRKTIRPTLNVMLANGNSSLHVPCPLGKWGDGSLCPHVVRLALATDAWGAVQAHPASNCILVDDQAHDRAVNSCCYVEKRHREEKLLLGGVHTSPGGQIRCAIS